MHHDAQFVPFEIDPVVANPETMETEGDDDASGQVKTAMLAAPVTEPKYIVEAAPLTGAIANAEDVR